MAKCLRIQNSSSVPLRQRRELRFSTSSNYLPRWVALLGFIGAFCLGVGIVALWFLDTPLGFASYVVAAGGSCLGGALWFSQPTESAVVVGDAGIGVEVGRQVSRIPWHAIRSVRLAGETIVVEGEGTSIRFLLGANRRATSWVLKEATERVADVMDINRDLLASLPPPAEAGGYAQLIEQDQVTGLQCTATQKVISVEDDARFCPHCGQVFRNDGAPDICPSCGDELSGRLLRA